MKLIVGLGNPGRDYQHTRHNVGFRTIDRLEEMFSIPVDKKKFNALYGKGNMAEEEIILAKPLTYMNLSGESIIQMAGFFKLPPGDLVVICDDIHLPLGQIRIRLKGSAGGHNGLESVIQHLSTREFIRVRMGVEEPPPGYDQKAYVLSRFSKTEEPLVKEMIESAAQAVQTIIRQGISTAMNQYNVRKNKTGDDTL